jgi:CelD/BcsL family acetyltransferase involved in cellulose biosynthesis
MFTDEELVTAWDRLAVSTGASPFSRPGWFEAWWRAFGDGRPQILQARRAGRIVGVLPVRHRRGKVTSLDNWHTFTCGPVAETPEIAQGLIESAMNIARLSADLGHLSPDDAELVVGVATRRGAAARPSTLQRSPYIRIEGSFEEYLARRNTKFLARIRQRRRKLEKEGELELTTHDGSAGGWENLDELLAEFLRIEGMGWKADAGTAILSSPKTAAFYTDVARWAAAKGILKISMLRLSGRVIAAELALDDGRAHYGLKVGYDPEFRAAGPGFIMAYDLIESAFDRGLESFEFTGSASEEKLRWTEDVHVIKNVRVFPPTVGGYSARLGLVAATAGRKVRHEAAERLNRNGAGNRLVKH